MQAEKQEVQVSISVADAIVFFAKKKNYLLEFRDMEWDLAGQRHMCLHSPNGCG